MKKLMPHLYQLMEGGAHSVHTVTVVGRVKQE